MVRYLAVAHQTSESPEFVEAVKELAAANPDAEIVLLVPATPVNNGCCTWTEGESRAVAAGKAADAKRRLESAGVTVVDTHIGDANPYEATMDALTEGEFDGVIVSTFPPRISRWLGMDLIRRLERSVDIPIIHVIAGRPNSRSRLSNPSGRRTGVSGEAPATNLDLSSP